LARAGVGFQMPKYPDYSSKRESCRGVAALVFVHQHDPNDHQRGENHRR
jgi:hypothetical protein